VRHPAETQHILDKINSVAQNYKKYLINRNNEISYLNLNKNDTMKRVYILTDFLEA